MTTKTSQQWAEITGRVVLDPDGWNRQDFQFSWYEELITEEEFNNRLRVSTILMNMKEK